MEREDFKLSVRHLVLPEDFEENKHLLDVVAPRHYQQYIWFLKLGFTMRLNLTALNLISDLSEETALSEQEIILAIPKFRQIVNILDAHDL